MANFIENFGLGYLSSDEIVKLLSIIVEEGKPIVGYSGNLYFNQHYGDAEFIVRTKVAREENELQITGFDTHSGGPCVWELKVINDSLAPHDSDVNECRCLFKRANDEQGMVVVNLMNASVLPSYLEDEIIKAQMIAFPVSMHYYVDAAAYEDAQKEEADGSRWMISDGSIFPVQFLYIHRPEQDESKKDYSLDDQVMIRGTVKHLYYGKLKFGEEETNGFIRCFIDTQYGMLELIHTKDQIAAAERVNLSVGSTVAATCVLSGDVAIYEYESGAVFDEDHDLRLLQYVLIRGNAQRATHAFAENVSYFSDASGKEIHNRDEVISWLQYVNDQNKGKYHVYLATIIAIEEDPSKEPLRYKAGQRCLVLTKSSIDNCESIVFSDINDNGRIERLTVSKDSRYHFRIDGTI